MNLAIPPPSTNKFKVLSMDGGGVRGYLTVGFLVQVESHLDTKTGQALPLGRRFDLICGTSTGGIIALGLAAGFSARDIFMLYEMLIPSVFAPGQRRSWLDWWFRPRYSREALKRELERFFGDKTLEPEHLVTDVCVTGVSLTNGKPRFYKSGYLDGDASRLSERLADVALGTSAAPTFFGAHRLQQTTWMIDGGVCCNNPAVVAMIEALQFSQDSRRGTAPPSELGGIAMLSVGTGEQATLPFVPSKVACAGRARWARCFPEVALASQSQLSHFQAELLLGQAYHRFNPPLQTCMRLDDASRVDELKNVMDIDQATKRFLVAHIV